MSFLTQAVSSISDYVKEDPGSILFFFILLSIGIGALTNIPVSLFLFV